MILGFKGYKCYCEVGDHKFIMTDDEMDKFIYDDKFIILCPICKSDKVNIIEVEGEYKGY